jgi:hypothetical protein
MSTTDGIDVQSLVAALHNSDDSQMQALQKLNELACHREGGTYKSWSQELSVSLRLQGLVPVLLDLCVCSEVRQVTHASTTTLPFLAPLSVNSCIACTTNTCAITNSLTHPNTGRLQAHCGSAHLPCLHVQGRTELCCGA